MFINVSRQPAVQPQSGASRRLEPTPARTMSLPWDLSAQGTQLLSMFQAGGPRSPQTSIFINVSTGARRARSALFDAPQNSAFITVSGPLFSMPPQNSAFITVLNATTNQRTSIFINVFQARGKDS